MPSWGLAFWILLACCAGYAFARGGRTERMVAAMLVAAAVLTVLLRSPWTTRYSDVEVGVLAVDIALLVGIAALAVREARPWLIVLAALQAVTLLGHLGKLLTPELWKLGYALMITVPSYPGLVLLAAATRSRVRRRVNARYSGPFSG